MAEALLGIVIENLRSFVQDDLATILGVDQQIQKLSSYLTAIRAVLEDAEKKQITSNAVKDWLQKLTDAAYVLDDILDECSIHSKSSCLSRVHPKDILFRRDVGKRMKDITQRFHDIHEERSMFQLSTGVTDKQGEDVDQWRQTSSVITEPIIYGRDQDREQIVEFLLGHASNSQDLSIYTIVGMGGLGKTTLAKQVFNDARVSKHFDLTIWVSCLEDFCVLNCPEVVTLPSNMNQLTALREVTISGTLLECFQGIPSLQRLYLSECSSLPEWVGDMTSLKELQISGNRELRSLPSSIGKLTNLSVLMIYNCSELTSLPSSIQYLTNLSELYIDCCPQLEKRCKRETGKDWQYIAHIPHQGVVSFSNREPTYYGKFMSLFFVS
uniref:Disease resistance protein RGA3 n=1 Tax=Cajanus cajan TaxID=3821 RepID=A0A151SI05_CAJCA|nr:Putative disease resistance protein RGA3 [Cajanus cajan]